MTDFNDTKLLQAVEIVRSEMRDSNRTQEANEVIQRYGQIFHPANLPSLSAEDFKGFLLFKNNRHWTGIHRQSGALTADMPRLREALSIILDESQSIETRLRKLRPANGEPFLKGLARSIITPILFVVYPEKYGVLNTKAEEGMKSTDVYPTLPPSADFAEEYVAVNDVLQLISREFSLPLWFVDAIWWRIVDGELPPPPPDGGKIPPPEIEARFGLERYLHEFLLDNWQTLDLSKEWQLLEKDGDVIGSEYRTEVGRIDILAHHKERPEWLVIELKRDQAVDTTVGQILRYMGWVQKNLAGHGETVRGLIIARDGDAALSYALTQVPQVTLKTYRVHFELR